MKQEQSVHVRTNNNDWTSLNLLDYDFQNVALSEAEYILENSVPFLTSDLSDRVEEFNDMENSNVYLDQDYSSKVYLKKSELFDFICYVLWSEYSGQHDDLNEDTFRDYCKDDPVVQKILKDKGC